MDWPPPPMAWGPHFGPAGNFAVSYPPPWRPIWRGRGNPHPYFMPYMPRFRNGPPAQPEWALRQAERIRAWHRTVQAEQPVPETPEEDLGPAKHNNEQPCSEHGEVQDGEGQEQTAPEEKSRKRKRRKRDLRALARVRTYIERKYQKRLEAIDDEEEACMAPSSDHENDL